jgi:hypothetical protein
MRKIVFSLVGAVAVLALTASLAVGASKGDPRAHASAPLCGTLYTPPCTAPTVVVKSIVACKNTGTELHFPITVSGNAGLKSVTVKLGNKTIKTVKYTSRPKHKSLTVSVNTHGFKPGVYTLTVKVTDVRGKTHTRVVHFTICTPKPVFTG